MWKHETSPEATTEGIMSSSRIYKGIAFIVDKYIFLVLFTRSSWGSLILLDGVLF